MDNIISLATDNIISLATDNIISLATDNIISLATDNIISLATQTGEIEVTPFEYTIIGLFNLLKKSPFLLFSLFSTIYRS